MGYYIQTPIMIVKQESPPLPHEREVDIHAYREQSQRDFALMQLSNNERNNDVA